MICEIHLAKNGPYNWYRFFPDTVYYLLKTPFGARLIRYPLPLRSDAFVFHTIPHKHLSFPSKPRGYPFL